LPRFFPRFFRPPLILVLKQIATTCALCTQSASKTARQALLPISAAPAQDKHHCPRGVFILILIWFLVLLVSFCIILYHVLSLRITFGHFGHFPSSILREQKGSGSPWQGVGRQLNPIADLAAAARSGHTCFGNMCAFF
jgi:hypothetical protein